MRCSVGWPVRELAEQLRHDKRSGRWPPSPVRSSVGHRATMSDVTEGLWCRDEDAENIRHRSSRYPGATDLEPAWTLEAAADPHRVIRAPDPKSGVGYTRIIGYSASAGFVLTMIVDPEDNSGVTAWKTRGADLRDYLEGKE